jgi:CheY-like chemotaxis protein
MNDLTDIILVVEDNAEDVLALKRALEKAEIANPVRIVTNARDAIAYLAGTDEFSDRSACPLPFLILLDLKLSPRDGFEVLAWIREQRTLADVAVVVLSGSEDALDQQRAYVLGARSYLIKPPTPEDLQRLMRSLKVFWSRFEERAPPGIV